MAETNAFAGIAQGVNQGMQWAQGQASLDLERSRVQQQQAQYDEQQKQFKAKLGMQMTDEVLKTAMLPAGPLKETKLKSIQKWGQEAGVPIDETWIASMKDQNYSPLYAEAYQAVTGTQVANPQFFNDTMANASAMYGQEFTESLLKSGIANMQAASKQAWEEKKLEIQEKGKDERAIKAATVVGDKQAQVQNRLDQRLAQSAHNQIVTRFKSDKELGRQLQQFKSLENALSVVEDVDKVTPQQVHEFQQSVRRSLNIGGTSGIDERSATYINTLGLSAENFKQFLTGEPADIAKDDALLTHIKDVAKVELGNIRGQTQQRIDALTAGQEHIYEQFPKMRKSLDTAIAAAQGQFVSARKGQGGKTPDGLNPAQLQAAQKMRAKLDATPAGPEKNKLIQKVQAALPLEVRQKVGLP